MAADVLAPCMDRESNNYGTDNACFQWEGFSTTDNILLLIEIIEKNVSSIEFSPKGSI